MSERVITNSERYEFIRNVAYKIYAFSDGKHFVIQAQCAGYSDSEFDKLIDSAIIDIDTLLKKNAMAKLSQEEKKLLGL